MRFHVPAIPGQPVKGWNSTCAYTQKVLKFGDMMGELGHEVVIYGGGGCDSGSATYIPTYGRMDPIPFDVAAWGDANHKAVEKIRRKASPGDFLCLIGGRCQQPIADNIIDLIPVEFGVGYGGVFSQFRVFESYAWMHMVYAQYSGDAHAVDGNFYDSVIPNYWDAQTFPIGLKSKERSGLLYVGRLVERKGVQIAVETAIRLGKKIRLAGEGNFRPYENHADVEYIGAVGAEERNILMAESEALLAPTQYIEPFGGVAVEAQFCGCPAITTDWGGFTETVQHGVTGFRCRTMGEFEAAAQSAPTLDRKQIRNWAVNNFSFEAVGPKYESYFEQVLGAWTGEDDFNGSGTHGDFPGRYGPLVAGVA